MTTTRIYRWDDPSAPVLSGVVGAWKAIVKACLYGNGSGVAYGTGPAEKTAAGWSLPFADTSTKLVVRNSLAAGGSGCYYRLLDDGSGTGGAKESLSRTYAAMSDIDTGTVPTPSVAQLSAGSVVRKSETSNSAARKWVIIADEITFYGWCEPDAANNYGNCWSGGGDFASEVAGDGSAFFNMGKPTQNSTFGGGDWQTMASNFNSNGATTAGLWAGTGYGQSGSPVGLGLFAVPVAGLVGAVGMAKPAPGSSKNYYVPAMVKSEGMIRGRMRGLYQPMNVRTGDPNATIDSGVSGVPIGSEIMLLASVDDGAGYGRLGVETELSWS